MITCRELIDFIDAYRSTELPAAERAEFERHLSICPSCVNYLDGYEKTIAMARASAGEDAATSGVPAELIQAILAARRAR